MRRVDISYVRPGMKLARTIYNDRGEELLTAGVKLTEGYIQNLIKHGMLFVWVELFQMEW